MKNYLILFCIALLVSCNSKDKRPLIGDTPYQQELNSTYKDASKSPLKKSDLKSFKGLDFFPVDSSYIVTAKFVKATNASIFKMATTR
jgi:uncharacterized protein (DUF1684 family)